MISITLYPTKIEFSKDFVRAIGHPAFISLYLNREKNWIAFVGNDENGSFEFAGRGHQPVVTNKNVVREAREIAGVEDEESYSFSGRVTDKQTIFVDLKNPVHNT